MSGRRSQNAPRAQRGALTLIALLFVLSVAVRLGSGSGAAIAREVAGFDPQVPVKAGAVCQTTEDVARALDALKEREAQVAAEESRIEERLAALAESEAAMEATLSELIAAEEALSATLSVAQSAAEDDITRLTAVYEAMKPKEAAALFSEMETEFAAGFLARMRPEAAAQVMAGLDPEAAYAISVVLAARNADVPKE